MRRARFFLILIVFLLLASSGALAMSSTNYRLDWFTPMTGNGGGSISSANYAASFTVGQSAIGTLSSTNYEGCLGYWCSGTTEYQIYLPLLLKNS